ncbi:undecaprenyl-diphosphatase [Faunimonas pinastri]|uniref:Undecaprenyl-diphosphatase n=1 Tax=Faunimonas pinastri TaxID=1855383 RepID=A0A1H9FM81_9HYPH|nr:phosphatase PAP2 family protein [Faunimonas pinastri]SEQ38468.1 undecaprenyl-diphosphatase [Faunimonas pinastri]
MARTVRNEQGRPSGLARWIPVEFGVLVLLCLTAASLLAFGLILNDIRGTQGHAFDEAVLLALRHPENLAKPIGPAWVHKALHDITSLGSNAVLALITGLVCLYLLVSGKRAATLLVLVAIAGGALLSAFLKFDIQRPRPDVVPHLVHVNSFSFPSSHAMLSAVTYLTLGALVAQMESRRRVRIFLIAASIGLTLLIGFSRLYLGVHWPTDVLAGWAIGSAWALICWLVAGWLQRRGQVEPDEPGA